MNTDEIRKAATEYIHPYAEQGWLREKLLAALKELDDERILFNSLSQCLEEAKGEIDWLKQAETMYVVIRKYDELKSYRRDEFIDMDSFADSPGRAVQKSNRKAITNGSGWASEHPIVRTVTVFVKEL